jgi:thiol-disulfide isomerase/thioredoxin
VHPALPVFMRVSSFICSIILAPGLLLAEPSPPPSVAAQVIAAARQEALEKILSERGTAGEFERALAAARDAGLSSQAILEARFLYQVDKGDDAALAAMLPDFLKQRAAFKLEDSAIFSVEEEWLAVVEYVSALASLAEGDNASFKKHITEAFWLNPEHAAAFAPHIEQVRMRHAMEAFVFDFALKSAPLSGGETVELKNLIDGKKAMLLHFWSPWSRECVEGMPDFIATAEMLEKNGVAVVSMVADGMPGLIEEAALTIRPHAEKQIGAWLIDPKNASLARQLRVRKFPTMVILSRAGKVLFNGDATDAKLWEVLHRIDTHIVRPSSPDADR